MPSNSFNNPPGINPKEELLLRTLNFKKGDDVDFVKRANLPGKTSDVAVGSHITGKLDADMRAGQPIYLDTKKKIAFNEVIKREDGRIVFRTDSSVYELMTPLQPEFGKFGVRVGDIDTDGFTAFNSNHSSNQDAFAISKNRNLFAVSDGIGSREQSGAVSRFITKKVAEEITDLTQLTPTWIDNKLRQLQRDKAFITAYKKSGMQIKEGGSATLTIVNRIRPNEFQLYVLGDSPAYVVDQSGNVLASYGTESAGSSDTGGSIGISPDGSTTTKGTSISKIIKLNKGEKIVIGSDYLSDGLLTYEKNLKNKIVLFNTFKREGGYYDIDGSQVVPSTVSSGDKKKYQQSFVPWNPGIENTLRSMEKSIINYRKILQNPVAYLSQDNVNYNPDEVARVMKWQNEETRNLNDFLKMKTGKEFYDNVTSSNSWKEDDATVLFIK